MLLRSLEAELIWLMHSGSPDHQIWLRWPSSCSSSSSLKPGTVQVSSPMVTQTTALAELMLWTWVMWYSVNHVKGFAPREKLPQPGRKRNWEGNRTSVTGISPVHPHLVLLGSACLLWAHTACNCIYSIKQCGQSDGRTWQDLRKGRRFSCNSRTCCIVCKSPQPLRAKLAVGILVQ